jgi:hypothetical protein
MSIDGAFCLEEQRVPAATMADTEGLYCIAILQLVFKFLQFSFNYLNIN